jgi:hypothetical protein
MRYWNSEQRHQSVAEEAADGPLETPHLRFGLLEQGVKEGQHPVGAELPGKRGTVRQLAIQYSRLLVLSFGTSTTSWPYRAVRSAAAVRRPGGVPQPGRS